MMPVPIIARQRALSRVGEIRIGERGDRGPRKLDTFRVTSQQRDLVERVAQLYGGRVQPWSSPVGEAWQVVTEAQALPVLVVAGYSLSQVYELWEGASRCERRCDGEEEQLTGGPCVCAAEGVDRCDIVTRLMLLLPETGTSLGWQLRSTGEAAARELAGAMELVRATAGPGGFCGAVLRLSQRRSVGGGQVRRYAVPVLDVRMPGRDLPVAEVGPADGPVFTPVAARAERPALSVGEAVDATSRLAGPPERRSARAAAPIGEVVDFTSSSAGQTTVASAPSSLVVAEDRVIDRGERVALFRELRELGLDDDGIRLLVTQVTGVPSTGRMTVSQMQQVLEVARADMSAAARVPPPDPQGGGMDGGEPSGAAPIPGAVAPPATPGNGGASPPSRVISDRQRALLFATAHDRGVDDERLHVLVEEVCGVGSVKAIPADMFEGVLAVVRAEIGG